MNKYWKDPRLDDEGTYDYLVEELPKDTAKWEWYYEVCQSCGKEHRLNFDSAHYFYCWDGWDSMTYVECWRCKLKSKVYSIKVKIKKKFFKKIEQRRDYHRLIKSLKEKNVVITKELKEVARRVCRIGG